MCCESLRKFLPDEKKQCISHSNVVKENGKEFRINSASIVCKIKIDGCLIDDNTINKCDYLLKVCDHNKIYIVELKGSDIMHAIKQILSTIPLVEYILKDCTYEGIIISSAVPKAELKFRQEQERLRKNMNIKITKFTSSKAVTI